MLPGMTLASSLMMSPKQGCSSRRRRRRRDQWGFLTMIMGALSMGAWCSTLRSEGGGGLLLKRLLRAWGAGAPFRAADGDRGGRRRRRGSRP